MFGITEKIATKLVRRARAIAIDWDKSADEFTKQGNVPLAAHQRAVASTLKVLAGLVQEVFELGEVLPEDPKESKR